MSPAIVASALARRDQMQSTTGKRIWCPGSQTATLVSLLPAMSLSAYAGGQNTGPTRRRTVQRQARTGQGSAIRTGQAV